MKVAVVGIGHVGLITGAALASLGLASLHLRDRANGTEPHVQQPSQHAAEKREQAFWVEQEKEPPHLGDRSRHTSNAFEERW